MRFASLQPPLKLASVVSVLLTVVPLFGPSLASAQPVPAFLDRVGGSSLTDSNLGQSAIAVQKTCGQLGALNSMDPLTGSSLELFRRCNELVATANDLNGAPTGGLTRTLAYADDDELLAAFQQVNGEEAQASARMSQNASYEQFSNIGARLSALRGVSSASISSVAVNDGAFLYGSGGGAAADDASMPFGPWGWFIRGTYATGDRDASDLTSFAAENGFDFDQYGVTLGIDHMSGSIVWGIAVGYSSYKVEMQDVTTPSGAQTQLVEGGDIEGDSTSGSIYFDHMGQNNVYFSALASYGGQSFDMARHFIYFSDNTTDPTVTDQTRLLTANPDGDSASGSLTLGRAVFRGSWVIDPRIGLTYDRIMIDGFSEVDSGNGGTGPSAMQLSFDEQTIKSLRTNVGIQLSKNINTGFGSVRPTFSADWYHEFEDEARTIKTKYAMEDELAGQGSFVTGFDGCVSCFSLISEAPDTDFFSVGLGIATATRGGFQSFLMLEGLLGYKNLDAIALTIGMRGQF